MDNQKLLSLKVAPCAGAMCRRETFGALLAGGNLPIMNINEDGVRIWELCDGIRTVAEIEALLLDEYEPEGLRDRLIAFLRFCLDNGFMKAVQD